MSSPNPQPAPPLDLAQFDGHTPGPWVRKDRLGFYKPKSKTYIGQDDGTEHAPLVAIVDWHRRGSADRWPVQREEQEATVALIAAAPSLLAECQRLRAENESMRLAGRELAADLDAAESLIYDAYENLADEDELRAAIRERREEKAELATYLKNLPEVTEAKHE